MLTTVSAFKSHPGIVNPDSPVTTQLQHKDQKIALGSMAFGSWPRAELNA